MKIDESNKLIDSDVNDSNNNKAAQLASTNYDEIIFKCENLNYTLELANETNMFNQVYTGDANEITLKDLKPNTKYFLRVFASLSPKCRGDFTDTVSFQTNPSEPDIPNPPKQMGAKKKNELTFRWTTPNDNGSKITNYVLEYKQMSTAQSAMDILPEEFTMAYKGPLKQFILKKLNPSTCYGVRLAAENQIGISKFSKTVIAFTLGCVPNVPAVPEMIESTISTITLAWSELNDEVDFELQMLDMDDKINASHGFLTIYNGPLVKYQVCDLRRCSNYQFRLRAKNDEGYSAWSDTIKLSTKANIPNSPKKLRVKVHSISNIKVNWESPSENGGDPVSHYILELACNQIENYKVVYEGENKECLIEENLLPGTVYNLRVSCSNSIGVSESSQKVSFTTPSVKPGKILAPKLHNKSKSNTAQIRWSYPDDDGGSKITFYELFAFENSNGEKSEKLIYKGPEQNYVMNNLFPGRTYSVKLRACNENGSGEWSDYLQITTAAGSPNAPDIPLISVKSPNCIVVSWNEPQNNGSTITEYRLEWSMKKNEDFTPLYIGNALKFEIKGQMQPSNRYFVRVFAINVNGSSHCSNLADFIAPASVPSIINNIKIEESKSESILISWKQPNSNGCPIISYNLDLSDTTASSSTSPSSYISINSKQQNCEYRIDSLHPDTQYKLRIQALNSVGTGQFSHMIKVRTKALPPAPPQLECVSTSYNNIKLKWHHNSNNISNSPFLDGSSLSNSKLALNDYQIVYNLEMMPEKTAGEKFTCVYKGPLNYFKVNKLKESCKYLFRISALNETGQGKWSDILKFKTTKAPPVITKNPIVSEITKNSCLIEWEPVELTASRSSTSDIEDASKNSSDFIEYCLQLQSIKKDIEYRDIYKGQSTSFSLDDLESGCDYNIRLCAIRVQNTSGSKRLCSSFTPHVTFSTLKCVKNSSKKINSNDLSKKIKKESFLSRFIWPSFYLNLNSSDNKHFSQISNNEINKQHQQAKSTSKKSHQSGKVFPRHSTSIDTKLTTLQQTSSNRNSSDQQWALIFILFILMIAFSIAFLGNSLFKKYYESSTSSEL